jgi:hypothetical protein
MKQIIPFPLDSLPILHNTGIVSKSSHHYGSWSQPPNMISQTINCIIMPAQSVKILSVRMVINVRTGTTSNSCRFNFCIIDADTGNIINTLPTTPSALDPMNLTLFPLMAWQTVYQAASESSAPVINTGEYLGIVYTGLAGTQNATNNLDLYPLVEVMIGFDF